MGILRSRWDQRIAVLGGSIPVVVLWLGDLLGRGCGVEIASRQQAIAGAKAPPGREHTVTHYKGGFCGLCLLSLIRLHERHRQREKQDHQLQEGARRET